MAPWASSTAPVGDEWHDLGPILPAIADAKYVASWVGAGDVPLSLGDGRYLAITHTGNLLANCSRMYTLDAVVLNFNQFDSANPESLVESRLDGFMVPATRCEIEGPYADSVGNVIFSCGSFERDGDLFVIYGGGDTYVMVARVSLAELLDAMRAAGR